jgi:hypothetical protein
VTASVNAEAVDIPARLGGGFEKVTVNIFVVVQTACSRSSSFSENSNSNTYQTKILGTSSFVTLRARYGVTNEYGHAHASA